MTTNEKFPRKIPVFATQILNIHVKIFHSSNQEFKDDKVLGRISCISGKDSKCLQNLFGHHYINSLHRVRLIAGAA